MGQFPGSGGGFDFLSSARNMLSFELQSLHVFLRPALEVEKYGNSRNGLVAPQFRHVFCVMHFYNNVARIFFLFFIGRKT